MFWLERRLATSLLFIGLAAATHAWSQQPTPAPVARPPSSDAAANAPMQSVKDEEKGAQVKDQTQAFHRKGGRTNREPTDTRIKEEGIKMPPCATESREGLDCSR